MRAILLLGLFFWTFQNLAALSFAVPKNQLEIPADGPGLLNANITETSFNEILTEVENLYAPIISQQGARLEFVKDWRSQIVNSEANRGGAIWQVTVYGGLARHPAVTPDGLALIACHELGHHMAGVPAKAGSWSAVEGQADYFATAKCLRKLWMGKDNRVANENPLARTACISLWTTLSDQDLCVRAVMAGESIAAFAKDVAGEVGPTAALNTPDTTTVSVVTEDYPSYQCRLDTFLRGALCNLNSDLMSAVCIQNFNNRAGCWFPGGGSTVPLPTPPITPTPTPPITPTPKPPITPTPKPPITPTPKPPAEIARSPRLNAQNNYSTRELDKPIIVQMKVSAFAHASQVMLEISRVNEAFVNPNGTSPDPNALSNRTFPSPDESTYIVPRKQLQGRGVYYVRVLALDGAGQPVGRFSNPAKLTIER